MAEAAKRNSNNAVLEKLRETHEAMNQHAVTAGEKIKSTALDAHGAAEEKRIQAVESMSTAPTTPTGGHLPTPVNAQGHTAFEHNSITGKLEAVGDKLKSEAQGIHSVAEEKRLELQQNAEQKYASYKANQETAAVTTTPGLMFSGIPGKMGKGMMVQRFGDPQGEVQENGDHATAMVLVNRVMPTMENIPDKHCLVQVQFSHANLDDFRMVRGDYDGIGSKQPPFFAGSDFSGRVLGAGRHCRFRAGDEIFGCMPNTLAGFEDASLIGGAFSSYMLVPESRCRFLPKNLDHQTAAMLPLCAGTHLQVEDYFHDKGHPMKAGHKIMILGADRGVGACAVQLLSAQGCHVTAFCPAENAGYCKSLGATDTIDATWLPNEDGSGIPIPCDWSAHWTINFPDYVLDYSLPGQSEYHWSFAQKVLKKGGYFLTIDGDSKPTSLFTNAFTDLWRNATNDGSYVSFQRDDILDTHLDRIAHSVESNHLTGKLFKYCKLDKLPMAFGGLWHENVCGFISIDVESDGRYLDLQEKGEPYPSTAKGGKTKGKGKGGKGKGKTNHLK